MKDAQGRLCAIVHGGQILLGEVGGPSLGLLMHLGRGKDEIFTSGMHSLKEPALHLQRHLPSLPQLPYFFFIYLFFQEKHFFLVQKGLVVL